jgi:hypothetical protein
MHWFFAKKKEKEIEIKPIPGPVHRPRSRYTRRTTPRPAPKTEAIDQESHTYRNHESSQNTIQNSTEPNETIDE